VHWKDYKDTYKWNNWERQPDICHNGDNHVFLEIEPSGVEAPGVTKGCEPPGGKDRFQEFASREGEQLGDIS